MRLAVPEGTLGNGIRITLGVIDPKKRASLAHTHNSLVYLGFFNWFIQVVRLWR